MLFVRDTAVTKREKKKDIFQAKAKKQKTSTATFLSSKIEFKRQCSKKNKEYFILIEQFTKRVEQS